MTKRRKRGRGRGRKRRWCWRRKTRRRGRRRGTKEKEEALGSHSSGGNLSQMSFIDPPQTREHISECRGRCGLHPFRASVLIGTYRSSLEEGNPVLCNFIFSNEDLPIYPHTHPHLHPIHSSPSSFGSFIASFLKLPLKLLVFPSCATYCGQVSSHHYLGLALLYFL